MADIVNLRRARKAKDKRSREAQAEANRIRFGRTKTEKDLAKARTGLAERALDGHKMRDGEDES